MEKPKPWMVPVIVHGGGKTEEEIKKTIIVLGKEAKELDEQNPPSMETVDPTLTHSQNPLPTPQEEKK